jgi:hypothetical protein
MTTMFDGSTITQSPRGRCSASPTSTSVFTFGRVIFALCVLTWVGFTSAAMAVSARHARSDIASSLSANFLKLNGTGGLAETLY